ncbi:MAG: ABC transporter substrate-binding protein, partial [Nitrospirota bacterium]
MLKARFKTQSLRFAFTAGALVFALAPKAHAQQPALRARIGSLNFGSRSADAARSEAFRQGMRNLGYIEGKNIIIEWRYAEGKIDRLPAQAKELVRLKVDIIVVAGGNRLMMAAKNATKTIPIVMVGLGSDPVAAGYIESLARPGGNVTGLTNLTGELGGKRLELLKETIPKLARVAVLYDP